MGNICPFNRIEDSNYKDTDYECNIYRIKELLFEYICNNTNKYYICNKESYHKINNEINNNNINNNEYIQNKKIDIKLILFIVLILLFIFMMLYKFIHYRNRFRYGRIIV
jgi:ATP-dependent Zn protease